MPRLQTNPLVVHIAHLALSSTGQTITALTGHTSTTATLYMIPWLAWNIPSCVFRRLAQMNLLSVQAAASGAETARRSRPRNFILDIED